MIGGAYTQRKIRPGKAHCIYAPGTQYIVYSSCYNSVILFLNVKTFFVVLRPGLWSAATRSCGCCIKSSLIQTRHNWGKHTSHIRVAGGFMFFFSLSKSLVYIDSEMCVLAILKTNLKFALFTQVLPKKKP
jgi:hypothetical protein